MSLFRPINAAPRPAFLQYVEDSYRSGHPPPMPSVMDPYRPAHLLESEGPYRSGAIMHTPFNAAPAYVPAPVVHAPLPVDSRYVLQPPFPASSDHHPYAPSPQYVLVDASHLQLAPTSVDPYPRTLPNDPFRQPLLDWRSYHETPTQISSERYVHLEILRFHVHKKRPNFKTEG